MTKLSKVLQLSGGERALLFQSVLLLPLIHFGLLLLGYHRLRQTIGKLIPLQPVGGSGSATENAQRACEMAHIVSIASQHDFYKATCLRRSLLVWGLLRNEGISSKVCFGVRKMDRQLEAHAWVEYQGTVVNDSPAVLRGFQRLDDVFPAATSEL